MAENSLKLLKTVKHERLPRFYEFGAFRLDVEKRLLWRDGEPVPLMPKAFDVLLTLLRQHGQVVTKDELMASVWHGVVVEENSLNVHVSTLRKVLGEKPNEHRFIVTVPGIGYKFVADVREDFAEAQEVIFQQNIAGITVEQEVERAPDLTATQPVDLTPPPSTAAAPTTARARRTMSSAEHVVSRVMRHKRSVATLLCVLILVGAGTAYFFYFARSPKAIDSIAVLPLVNTSGDPNMEYLSDGISEALINSLTELRQLRVVARSTAFRYKGREVDPQAVGHDLNVRAVLTGRVRQLGDRLNIQVDLVDATTGAQLWGEEYERKVSDVLAIKQAIAREVTEKLRLRLSGGEQQRLARRDTTNNDSYQSYLRGRYFWNKRTEADLQKAIEYFNQAIAQDPTYAMAYAGLADCYQVLPSYSSLPPEETYVKARAAATKALAIDETLAEAHAALGVVKFEHEWDFAGAEREYRRAIELNPNYASAHQWYAEFLGDMERYEESIAEAKRALALDPLSLIINTVLGGEYANARRYEQAEEQLRKTIEMDKNFGQARVLLGVVYLRKGMYRESIDEVHTGRILQGANPEDVKRRIAALKAAYEQAGARGYWQERLNLAQASWQQGRGSAEAVAKCYAQLGERNEAFAWLDKAFERREEMLSHLKPEPDYDNLRSDPRFQDLLRRVGY